MLLEVKKKCMFGKLSAQILCVYMRLSVYIETNLKIANLFVCENKCVIVNLNKNEPVYIYLRYWMTRIYLSYKFFFKFNEKPV